MSYYARINTTPAGPLAPSVTGLVLVNASAGDIDITLPIAAQAAGRIYLCRQDASRYDVTLAPQGADTITPAGLAAPNAQADAGDALVLVPHEAGWQVLGSALPEIVRETAVASLIAYPTIAHDRVESERVDPVEQGDAPRLIVLVEENREGISGGGTAPAFRVTLTLMIQALVEQARRQDAVAQLDTLCGQVRDCLLGDPVWVALTDAIPTLHVTRKLEGTARMVIGDARTALTCTWIETYLPRVTDPLHLVTLTTTPPSGTQSISLPVTLPPS